jgi:hypothetical protein
MVCDVVVLENSYFAVTAADGSYQISDVPPGTYTVHAWHVFGGAAEATLVIAADGDVVTHDVTLVSTKVLRQIVSHRNKHGRPYASDGDADDY